MDYRFIVVGFDGEEDHYDHIQLLKTVSDFKYGMEVCAVQNEDTIDFWALAPVKNPYGSDWDAAHDSLARYYYDAYGWDYNDMESMVFTVKI